MRGVTSPCYLSAVHIRALGSDAAGSPMSKRFAVTVALVALASVLAPPHPHAQLIPTKTPFDRLYQDYAGGDYDAITRALPSARSLAVLQAPPDAGKLRKWLGNKWDRTKAVFILEFAGAEAQFAPGAAITALSEGRLFVISRPTPRRSVAGGRRLRARVAQRRHVYAGRSHVRLDPGAVSRHDPAPVHSAAGRASRHARSALRAPSRGGAGTEVLERSIAT